jgi:hypothetical protein
MKDGMKMNFILLAALHPASYSLSKDDNSRLPIKTYAFCPDPTDERVVEFQRAIYEEMERSMIGRNQKQTWCLHTYLNKNNTRAIKSCLELVQDKCNYFTWIVSGHSWD